MTEKKTAVGAPHNLELYNRAKMIIQGVSDVSEFSDTSVKLKSSMGDMLIRGSGLTINRLNTDDGNVEINGAVDLIQYQKKQKDGFLKSLLK